ncbi:conserved hypothetical protein [Talaromyces stipitatus ATCC 10500]|uniref:SAP domain-containing protein n=1 Tax=Talaromyces stipitatus (strain ATCC 10500 / CBS 375.48 / QM 6759 / NRRL 1006) TaxID=441959 RepID=B8LTW8_TALSN|nr:uncharacterized protein TSTA_071940 [Talaromyces stipitatus ATCC 10500]EED23798.1 conserved hypothetical protein [Talaromyces stipitatus ATCC 10500]
MRLALPNLSKLPSTGVETYLTSLKATQLKNLARETGIPSSGRKDELRHRISEELLTSILLHENKNHSTSEHKSKTKERKKSGKELSILSIDMGIQNLAFAHLIVRPLGEHAPGTGAGVDRGLIMLNAWHRINVQELRSCAPATQTTDTEIRNDEIEEESIPQTETTTNKNFEPDSLSYNAYVLLSSLLQAYKPTHILIERQRFRSGGQSAVLEWSLRVGVFEGMLHAVLCTMREVSRLLHDTHSDIYGLDGVVDGLKVYAISPARIKQFWDEGKSESLLDNEEEGRKGKGQNQRGVKTFKMDIVGDLLSASTKTGKSLSCWDLAVNTDKGEKGLGVSDVVDAYLRRWDPQAVDSQPTGLKGRKKSMSATTEKAHKIDKMDDLADCLLQGVTWLEWQARRARIVRGEFLIHN